MYVKGPNATKEFPYGSINKGANFWMTWERAGNIEVWDEQGGQLLSQGIGVSLHGQYSRAADQKSFCITARAKYDENSRMNAKLFPNRENTEFQSIVRAAPARTTTAPACATPCSPRWPKIPRSCIRTPSR